MRHRRRHVLDLPEINLVPMLDMISLLIQVLLVNIHFGALAQIEARQAKMTGAPAEAAEALDLVVSVDPDGLHLAWTEAGKRTYRTLPCATTCAQATDYDLTGLASALAEVKGRFPDERAGVVSPRGAVDFDTLTRVMDTVGTDRTGAPLFPDLVVAGGKPAAAPSGAAP